MKEECNRHKGQKNNSKQRRKLEKGERENGLVWTGTTASC